MIKFRKLIFLLILILLLSGCQNSVELRYVQKTNKEMLDMTPKAGGEINVPLTLVDTFNPFLTHNKYFYYFSKLIYDSVAKVDSNGELVMSLAKSVEFAPDNSNIIINLRDDVYWHDGSKLTSSDVVFTYNLLSELPLDSPYKRLMWNVAGSGYAVNLSEMVKASEIDENRVMIALNSGYNDAKYLLTIPIMNSKIQTVGDLLSTKYSNFVGTGPYKVADYNVNKYMNLVANEKYFLKMPMIEKINGKVYEREHDIISAFEAGQLHVCLYEKYDYEKYEANPRIIYEEFGSNERLFMVFNMEKPYFLDLQGKALRSAICSSIDKNRIKDSIFLGKAEVINSLVKPAKYGTDDSDYSDRYNLSAAVDELSAAGFKDIDGDGYFDMQDGSPIRLRVVTNFYNRDRELIVDNICDDAKKISVQLLSEYGIIDKVKADEHGDTFASYAELLKNGDFDIALIGFDMGQVEDLTAILSSSRVGVGLNLSRYSNENIDSWLLDTKYRSQSGKNDAYRKIEELNSSECIYFPLIMRKYALLIDTRICNPVEPNVYDIYSGLVNCYIPVGLQ